MTIQTGAKSKVRMQPLAVYEYTDLSRIPRMIGDSPDDAIPTVKNAFHAPIVESKCIRLVDKKWVYRFVDQGGVPTLKDEGFLSVENGKQQIQYVDWSAGQRSKRQAEAVRPLAGPKGAWSVDLNERAWVVLSWKQIPIYRIAAYLKDKSSLDARAQIIDATLAPASANGSNLVAVYLLDPLEISLHLAIDFMTAIETREASLKDSEKQSERTLHSMIQEIARSETRLKDKWLDWGKFQAAANKRRSNDELLRNLAHRSDDWLFSWKTSKLYRNALFDLSGCDEREKAAIDTVRLTTRPEEVKYLTWELSQADSWYRTVLEGTDIPGNRFQFARKTVSALANDSVRELIEPWLVGRAAALALKFKISTTAVVEVRVAMLEELVGELNAVVARVRWTIPGLERNARGLYFQIRRVEGLAFPLIGYNLTGAEEITVRTIWDTTRYRRARREWAAAVSKLAGPVKVLLLGIEGVNCGQSFLSYGAEPNFQKGVGAFGAVCDLIGAMEFIAKSRIKRSATTVAIESAEKLSGRVFAVVGFVGGLTDVIGSVYGVKDAYGKGQRGVVAGNAVIGIAAAATMIGSCFAIAGAMSIAGPIGIAAAVLYIIGTGLVLWFSEEPLETWARDSRWGMETLFRSSKWKPQTYTVELHQLMETLCQIQPDCFIGRVKGQANWDRNGSIYYDYTYYLVIRIQLGPVFVKERSKIHLTIETARDRVVVSNKLWTRSIVLKPGEGRIVEQGGKPIAWEYAIPTEDMKLGDAPQDGYYEFSANAYLDLNGEGVADDCYPPAAKPIKASGNLHLNKSW